MKRCVLFIVLCMLCRAATAQTNSVFLITTEYTPQTGYNYYFDKLNPQTGVSTHLTLLPAVGHYTGYAFFNCYNHYVFQGVESIAPNGDCVNKLYELDTLGNLIRTLPMDTTTGTWYKMCLPAAGSPVYYALRWNTSIGQYQIETINAITGTRTVQVLPPLAWYLYLNSDAAITRDNIIWMGMDDQMTGRSVLMSLDPSNGALSFQDTLAPNNYYDCLVYDCPNDTIYGFMASHDTVQGAELLKIHPTSSTVIHTGITATGSGMFVSAVHARLADRSFYVRSSQQSFLLPNFNVTAPTFAMPVVPNPSFLSGFCYAAPRESCTYYTTCGEVIGVEETTLPDAMNVFPNPANNGLLTVQQEGSFTYELIDVSGRLIANGKAFNQATIDVGNVASGMYIVRVLHGEQSTAKKVVIGN